MPPKPNSTKLLEGLHEQLTRRMFSRLAKATPQFDQASIESAIRGGYSDAHSSGAQWQGLVLLGAKFPPSTRNPLGKLEALSVQYGFAFKHSNAGTQASLDAQVNASITRYTEAMLMGELKRAGLEARVAGFATRWGVQQGINDMAANSSAVLLGTPPDGADLEPEPVELMKRWVRLAARAEHRSWHDALERTAPIPYSALFTLRSPLGTRQVFRPYDAALPLSEKIRCGHGIRVDPPAGARGIPWTGAAFVALED